SRPTAIISLSLHDALPICSEVVYLQADVNVTRAGAVEVRLESAAPVTFWVDEDPFEKQNRAEVRLTPGLHRITVRAVVGDAKARSEEHTSELQSRFDLVCR